MLATDVFVEGQPALFNEWHHDVVVGANPAELPDYNTLSKSGKNELAAHLLDRFTCALHLFNPRGPLPRPGWWGPSDLDDIPVDGGTL